MSIPGYPREYTSHVDHSARSSLPPRELWPLFKLDSPELCYPARVNCATVLLDNAVIDGDGERIAVYANSESWSYAELLDEANQIANVLVRELAIVPGNHVLPRGFNSPQHSLQRGLRL